jgi:hypothetical protein
MKCSRFPSLWLLSLLVGSAMIGRAPAQWVTQTNSLKAGWNAVYLQVDTSHTNLSGLVGVADPIEEIWLWNPQLPPGQALAVPQSPGGSQWSSWARTNGPASALQSLHANAAILVRVNSSVSNFDWRVKGRPGAPSYRWTLTGLNFIGFPTVSASPSFESFLGADAESLDWSQSAQIFRYPGGSLSETNPILVAPFTYRSTPVRRDQAYWVRAGDQYNQYFGPFQVTGGGSSGVNFGDSVGQAQLRLKNMSRGILTVTLAQLASEAVPAGQTPIAGRLPLLVRGSMNTTNLSFGFSNLTTGAQWTLQPNGAVGSEVELILGVDRSQLAGPAGTRYAGVLRFTDSLGLSQIDLAAAATVPSRGGLWVGNAAVGYVSQYLTPYAKAASATEFQSLLNRLGLGQGVNGFRYEWDPGTGRVLVYGGPQNRTGSYLLDGPVKLDSGSVPRSFPLRLLVHNNGSSSVLLQRAYIGRDLNSNTIVSTSEDALLSSQLASARRISAVHLPTSEGNIPWNFTGTMAEGSTLTTTVLTAHDDHSSNPFLHTYHPDHDNLDALFVSPLPSGVESYGIRRVISLQFTAAANDFESLTHSGTSLGGNYAETITFTDRNGDVRQFNVLGQFQLARITDIATLTTP